MIHLNELEVGMVLMSRELDPLWAEEPRKRYKALIGAIVAIDCKASEVTLRVNRELRMFKPKNLWYLPYEKKCAGTLNNIQEKLMGFIVGINEGQVGTFGIQEVAIILKKEHGIRPVKVRELIEAL